MLMESLSEKLWTKKTLESSRNGKMKSQDDLVHGKSYIDIKAPIVTPPEESDSKDWKLLIDPFIKGKSAQKVIRVGGLQVNGLDNPVSIKDPRDPRIPIRKTKELDLRIPKFKFDKWSVGSPPLKSTFIYGLNDNVNQDFLNNLFAPHGNIEQLKVYYHPKTRKHLGIAFASFASSNVANEIVAKYHGTSIMGNIVNIKPDPLCQITKKVLDQLIRSPVANIPDIIHAVQLKSHHKTAAYAFHHNERSQNYYTARGKVRKYSDTFLVTTPGKHSSETPGHESEHRQEKSETKQSAYQPLKLEQVSPKVDTPPHTIETFKHEDDISNDEKPLTPVIELPKTSKRDLALDSDNRDKRHKSLKSEFDSPDLSEEKRKEARLFDMNKDRKRAHEERKYEEWKMRTEMQIRADKTKRYIKEHCGGSGSLDKYSKEYRDYYKYYDMHYGRSTKDHSRSYHDEKYRSKKYDADKYHKYYDYYRHRDDHKRSSSASREFYEKIHKLQKSERYDLYHDRRDLSSTDLRDTIRSPSELERLERYKHSDLRESNRSRSKSRPRDESHFPERASKRKRSKSPIYHTTPSVETTKSSPLKTKTEKSGSATSHDTGYNSISPLPSPSLPKLPEPPTTDCNNPYGCARAVPRKDITKLKAFGFKMEIDMNSSRSSSPMSLDEEEPEETMKVEDISPNNTPKYASTTTTTPATTPATTSTTVSATTTSIPTISTSYGPPQVVQPPLLPLPPPVLPGPVLLPPPPPVAPVHYQTGQWLHTSYPGMYQQYGYGSYDPEAAADILARCEAAEKAATKQRELELSRQRRSLSITLLLEQMENVLIKDIKTKLYEKAAFAQLELVWNQEEDKKKKEEEELLAKLKEEQAQDTENISSSKAPDMPSLSEMRNLSDAKSDSHIRQQSHIRQTNLSFKVPKLNRMAGSKQQLGMRAQVIVKKMAPPQTLIERVCDEDTEDVIEEDLVCKRRQEGSRYNTIYSSSSSSSEEEEEEIADKEDIIPSSADTEIQQIDAAPKIPDKYSTRTEEEEELIMEQLFREELSEEDKLLFKMAYDRLSTEDSDGLLDGVTWLTPPEIPNIPRRRQHSTDLRHRTGCARTEGFYKVSSAEKMAMKLANLNKGLAGDQTTTTTPKNKKTDGKTTARSTRATQRRQATHYYDIDDVQYLQLSTRRKQVRFQRSDIHDWGLFAQEAISADEMVIEYVGEVVREIIANIREQGYIKQGIGSSYLFRIDQSSYIVDATHRGSISRFINHNCDPNCYARVISVVGQKKIVIYSKRDIAANEEITYDYKFAIEDDENKIPCLCNAAACRGFLN